MDGLRVLLVDDEVEFRDLLAKRLRKRKLDVWTAGDGSEALQVLATMPVDVVLLDMRMPGMSGTDTLREIKARLPNVEVLVLTGHAQLDVALAGMELGAFDFLLKPVDLEGLLLRLKEACRRKRSHTEVCLT
jgi:two-component system, OmpR family, response regulator